MGLLQIDTQFFCIGLNKSFIYLGKNNESGLIILATGA